MSSHVHHAPLVVRGYECGAGRVVGLPLDYRSTVAGTTVDLHLEGQVLE